MFDGRDKQGYVDIFYRQKPRLAAADISRGSPRRRII
jgi:hypothetical protein